MDKLKFCIIGLLAGITAAVCCSCTDSYTDTATEDGSETEETVPSSDSAAIADDTVNIRIVPAPQDCPLRVQTNYPHYGQQAVQGESRYFCCFAENYGNHWDGRLRMALMNPGGSVAEIYPPQRISIVGGGFEGWKIPCKVCCPVGTYRLVPLFQTEGTQDWFTPPYGGDTQDTQDVDWSCRVLPPTVLPAIRRIGIRDTPSARSLVHAVEQDKPFALHFTMTNRAKVRLEGQLKAVWHREFGFDHYPQSADDGISWADEIGRCRVSVSEKDTLYQGTADCRITTRRPAVSRYPAVVHLYFKADGCDEWNRLRADITGNGDFPNYIYLALSEGNL